ncbi:MAG: dihydropteroate synthase [Bacteroidota bacterium]
MIYQQQTINCRGRLLDLTKPVVMGILNVTPDSFFAGSRLESPGDVLRQAEKMLSEGAAILDVGGMSSRPGAAILSEDEELARALPAVEAIVKNFPEALISIDTIRSQVAKTCVEGGAGIVNDISAGRFDDKMYETVAALGTPYILMHMQGKPETMQVEPEYAEVVRDVLDFFIRELGKLRSLGVKDVIIDPGFGFGKTVEHNYRLLTHLHVFQMLEAPVLAGISRKSMICKVLKVNPERALNGTTALHVIALQQGSKILRAHDVREAVEVIQLFQAVENSQLGER